MARSGREMTKTAPCRVGPNVDGAVELLDVGLDDVHADTAAGDIGVWVLVENPGRKTS